MTKIVTKNFEVQIAPDNPVFVISVVSTIVNIPIWTLRKLDQMGVVRPKRIGKKTRCYSHVQVKQLNYIHYLLEKKKVNIGAIKVFLELSEIKE
jgi:DNA-binding transcriptional MerR regulator